MRPCRWNSSAVRPCGLNTVNAEPVTRSILLVASVFVIYLVGSKTAVLTNACFFRCAWPTWSPLFPFYSLRRVRNGETRLAWTAHCSHSDGATKKPCQGSTHNPRRLLRWQAEVASNALTLLSRGGAVQFLRTVE